jgi:cyclin D6
MAEYPASVVAASALLAAAGEVAGAHLPAFHAAVAACPFVNSVSMIAHFTHIFR